MRKHADAPGFGRMLTAGLLVAGPLLLLVAQAIGPNVGSSNKATELARIAAHKSTYLAAGLLFMLGGLVVLGAAIGLTHLFRGRGVLGHIGAVLIALGATTTVAFYAFGSLEYEMVNHAGLDRSQMALLLHKADKPASGAPIFFLFLIGIVLGLIVLGVAVWRSRVAPRWAAVVIAASGPIAFISNGRVLGIVSFAALLIGFAGLARGALSVREEDPDASATAPARAHRPAREAAVI